MIDRETRPLPDHPPLPLPDPQYAQRWIPGVFAALMGLLVFLIAVGAVPVSDPDFGVPRWVVALIGGFFWIVGVWILSQSLQAILWQRRLRRLALRHTDLPWMRDYPWDTDGVADHLARSTLAALVGVFITTLFAAIFVTLALTLFEGILPTIFAFAMAAICLLLLKQYLTPLLVRRKYGLSRVRFERFPYRGDHDLSLRVHCNRPIHSSESINCTLRCIERELKMTDELHPGHSSGSTRRRKRVLINCHQLYAETRNVDHFDASRLGTDFTVQFQPPPPDLGTRLNAAPASHPNTDSAARLTAAPARYWELDVTASTPGLDYRALFLIPFYPE